MDDRYDNFRIRPRSFDVQPQGRPAPRPQQPQPISPSQPQPAPAHHAPAHHQTPVQHPQTQHHQPVPVPEKSAPQPVAAQQAVQAPANVPIPAPHHQTAPRQQPKAKSRKKTGTAKKIFKTVGVLVLVGILAVGLFGAYRYGYKPYLDRKNSTANAAAMTETVSSDPAVQLSASLSKAIDLPSETPILVTVQDASKVKSNPFFVKSQSGDQVLYYQNAKVAVLYRPSTKKVINYSPQAVISNLQDASQQSQ